ncbi:MAG TPA: CotH kinase family protein [Polyangiaceae bacterium]|nr:CotH kinase family protein [Polyangiaceae bacterium]
MPSFRMGTVVGGLFLFVFAVAACGNDDVGAAAGGHGPDSGAISTADAPSVSVTTSEMDDMHVTDASSDTLAGPMTGATSVAADAGETSIAADTGVKSRVEDSGADATPEESTPQESRPEGGARDAATAVAIPKAHIGDEVFDESQVHSYYLTLTDSEYAKLMDLSTLLLAPSVVNEDRYVQASLRVDDTELPSIAVRFKGQFSIWGCVDQATGTRKVRIEPFFGNIDVCQRFSLKLDFNRYDQDARLDGLKKLNLHAMAADPSKMRERLGYALYRDMDVLAPRAVHARVYINGEYQGLFAAVEEVDGRFAANRFPESGDGNLYKEVWPSQYIGSADAEAALRTNDDPQTLDVSDFVNFKDTVLAATEADFASKLAPYIDFDYLARYIVVNRAINDFDGVMAFYFGWGPPPANHNLYWYHDSESGQFVLIPWDQDKSFWTPEPNFWTENEPNGDNITPNWNVITKSCDGYTAWFDNLGNSYQMMAIDCDPLLRLLRGQVYDSQKALTEEFIAGPFSESSVKARLDAWSAQITEAIADDALVDSANWQAAVDALLADVPKFQSNVTLMMDGLIDE